MAATVGMTIISRSSVDGESYELNLNYVNPRIFATEDESELQAAYRRADAVGRAICGFSQNTYVDTLINRSVSVTEELEG